MSNTHHKKQGNGLNTATVNTKKRIAEMDVVLPIDYRAIFEENIAELGLTIIDFSEEEKNKATVLSIEMTTAALKSTGKLSQFASEVKEALIEKNEDKLEGLLVSLADLEKELSSLREKAYIDPLTKMMNRRWMDENILTEEMVTKSSSLALIDLNDFKKINDAHGHAIGDKTLQFIAKELKKAVIEIDRDGEVIRFGGDEFVLFFPRTIEPIIIEQRLSTLQMSLCKKTFRAEVAGEAITFKTGISFGVKVAAKGALFTELMHVMDTKMYKNKEMIKKTCASMAISE
jgi:diguanylate cyclase (GGDEF)-like protein